MVSGELIQLDGKYNKENLSDILTMRSDQYIDKKKRDEVYNMYKLRKYLKKILNKNFTNLINYADKGYKKGICL